MTNAASVTSAVKRHLRGHGLSDVQVTTRSCRPTDAKPGAPWGWHSFVFADRAGLTVDQVVDALADFPRTLKATPSEAGFVSVYQDDY